MMNTSSPVGSSFSNTNHKGAILEPMYLHLSILYYIATREQTTVIKKIISAYKNIFFKYCQWTSLITLMNVLIPTTKVLIKETDVGGNNFDDVDDDGNDTMMLLLLLLLLLLMLLLLLTMTMTMTMMMMAMFTC